VVVNVSAHRQPFDEWKLPDLVNGHALRRASAQPSAARRACAV